jgi:hypothetical protein
VQTSESRRIESRRDDAGIIGKRSEVRIAIPDDTPVEHEVTVVMPRLPRRERIR